MSHDFDRLVADVEQCNRQLLVNIEQKLTAQAPVNDEDQHQAQLQYQQLWQESLDLLDQRALFLAQLSSIINTLTPTQIDKLGHLYESIIASDRQSVKWAQIEQKATRNSLRAIKNAEKALPIYQSHNK